MNALMQVDDRKALSRPLEGLGFPMANGEQLREIWESLRRLEVESAQTRALVQQLQESTRDDHRSFHEMRGEVLTHFGREENLARRLRDVESWQKAKDALLWKSVASAIGAGFLGGGGVFGMVYYLLQ